MSTFLPGTGDYSPYRVLEVNTNKTTIYPDPQQHY